jgi:hypothetical protein
MCQLSICGSGVKSGAGVSCPACAKARIAPDWLPGTCRARFPSGGARPLAAAREPRALAPAAGRAADRAVERFD